MSHKTEQSNQLVTAKFGVAKKVGHTEENTSKIKSTDLTTGQQFTRCLDMFCSDMCALQQAFPITMNGALETLQHALQGLESFIANTKHTHKKEGENIHYEFQVSQQDHLTFRRVNDELITALKSQPIIADSFLSALVSKFDAYIGNLMRVIFQTRTDTLRSSAKTLTLREIMDFSTIEEAQKFIIEEEVDSLLRESHDKQVEWFEKLLDIKVRNVSSWPNYIEITERRNLLAHCNGQVNKHYINNCKKNQVTLPEDLGVGVKLTVDEAYFQQAFTTLYEIGFMLGHIVWRKVSDSNESDAYNNHLLMKCYDLLVIKQYEPVIRILSFILSEKAFKNRMDERYELINVINLAQAYKKSGDSKRCEELLKRYHWDTKNAKFQQAYYVLSDNFEKAAELMSAIEGSNDRLKMDDYKEWPLFDKFRLTDVFREAYKSVFQQEYTEPLTVPEDFPKVSEVLGKRNQKALAKVFDDVK